MVESGPPEVNFLLRTHLPSIGSFLTVLQFFDHKSVVKKLLRCLSLRHGSSFYSRHVKHSLAFSSAKPFLKCNPLLITLDFNNPSDKYN
jgi:hypothetical protein